MTRSTPTLVIDTNIWLDLRVGRIAECLGGLGWALAVADFVLDEVADLVPVFVTLGVEEWSLAPAQIREVLELRGQQPALSLCDLASLVLARDSGQTLLTGDRKLRALAEDLGVEVRGALWVLDEFVARRILTPEEAASALNRMLAANRRLPKAECDRRLRAWESGGR